MPRDIKLHLPKTNQCHVNWLARFRWSLFHRKEYIALRLRVTTFPPCWRVLTQAYYSLASLVICWPTLTKNDWCFL
jgi:hypothetical protein